MLVTSDDSRIIDFGAFTHMTGTKSLFGRLSQLFASGKRVVHASSQITFENVLYVPEFPVNLLSISAITKQLLCFVTFFHFHFTFQDLWMGRRIGLSHERGT